MLDKKTLKEIHDNVSKVHYSWQETINCNCYMFAINLDMSVWDVFSLGRFCIGDLSNTYKEKMTANDMIKSLYLDMDKIGVDINKYHNEELLDDEWLIALFNSEIDDDFHFLRTYPKIYNKPNYWYHKKSFSGIITHTDSSCNEITNPKEADMRLYKCRYLTIPYKYVDTFKVSVKKDF